MLIDTHCHFDFSPFNEDIDYYIWQYQQAGVSNIIVPTVSQSYFDRVITLANTHSSIYYALGLHPIYTHHMQDLQTLNDLLVQKKTKLIAVGEIGLDGYIDEADLTRQQYFLSVQLELAKQYDLPVMLHSRKTHALLYKILKNMRLPRSGVIHGFSGSYEEAMQFIRLGFFIGVGGVITYERAKKTRHAISKIPLSSIVLETDAPDMPLSGYQGEVNRPAQVVKIFDVLITLRQEGSLQILDTILTNTLTLFYRINTIANP